MIKLAENNGRIYLAITTYDPGDFVSPFSGISFPCLIWDHEGRFANAEREQIARTLLNAGCRYAVCGGQNCDAWHLSVDFVFVDQHLNEPEEFKDTVFVMTTSHAGESPDDVAFFFVLNTNFDDHDFKHYLVLHIGNSPMKAEIDEAVRKYAHNDKVVD